MKTLDQFLLLTALCTVYDVSRYTSGAVIFQHAVTIGALLLASDTVWLLWRFLTMRRHPL